MRDDAGVRRGSRIQLEGVSKTYVSEGRYVEALAPIDIDIEPGEFLSVVGPSGCGKSTLMLMVAGLLAPTSGVIRIGDNPLSGHYTDVGIVFQDHLLLEFRTALNNVLLQAQIRGLDMQEARERIRSLFDRLGLAGAEDRFPNQLSGGMRQRVSLARALIHDPPVLLMDEPFGALDAITRTQMKHDLQRVWMEQRKTVLFITHSVEEAVGLGDRVLVMTPGPGRIAGEISIDIPRPRRLAVGEQSDLGAYTDQVYGLLTDLGVLHVGDAS